MDRLLLVCLGGALGSGARYLAAQAALALLGPAFPYGTLFVNALGSFAIALVMHVSFETLWISPALRVFLTTGVMGGFTTYSTFNYETLQLAADGEWLRSAMNVGVTVIACLASGLLGTAVGRAWVGGS